MLELSPETIQIILQFPLAAIVFWLLVRIEKRYDKTVSALQRLAMLQILVFTAVSSDKEKAKGIVGLTQEEL